MPIASGRADVTSETGLTGWTAVLDSADLYVPSAAKFANAQAEEAINVVRISLPAGASDKEKLSLVIGPYCSNAFEKVADLYANGKVIRVIPMPLTTEQENYSAKGLFKIG